MGVNLLQMRRRTVIASQPHLDARTGSLLTWTKCAGAPLRSFQLSFDPIQDLHGYDGPWPAGGGVNLLDAAKLSIYGSGTYGLTCTIVDGGFRVAGTVETQTDGRKQWRVVVINQSELDLTSLNVVGFLSGTITGKTITLRFDQDTRTIVMDVTSLANGESIDITVLPVIYSGTAVPTKWTPYSNICPISGRTGVTVYASGTDTTNPTSYPVTWTSAGTVYGGTLDVTTGELVVDRAMVDLGTQNYSRVSGSDGVYLFTTSSGFSGKKLGVTNIMSDYISTTSVTSWSSAKPNNSICGSASSTTVVIRADDYENADELKTALNGHYAVYELADPIIYQLTPQQISTIAGTNNLWSDADTITASAWTY